MSTGISDAAPSRAARQRGRGKSSRLEGPDRLRTYTTRSRVLMLMLVGGLLLIVGKLFYIQLVDAANLKRKAQSARNQALSLYNRGRIMDRNGVILAQDTLLYDLFAHPAYFFGMKPEVIATALAPVLEMDEIQLRKILSEPYTTISIRKNLNRELVARIREARALVEARDPKTHKLILDDQGRPVMRRVPLPGLDLVRKNVRNYPQGNLAAHVLGYVNDEAGVSSGVEAAAAGVLKKKPLALSHTYLDGQGNLVDPAALDPRHIVMLPKAQDVHLTLDARLQYIAERELAVGLQKSHAKRGAVIMMDPRTGELLAFAVLPTYHPNRFYRTEPETLKNWAITDVYPPGSTFKILTVASGLETGVIQRHSRILDTGRMKLGGWQIQNYDYARHGAPGWIDLVYLFMHSSNIASAKISLMMPPKRQYLLLRQMGMGSQTGVDLPGESAGLVPPPDKWDESTHGAIGYGYSMAATPLQVASAVAALANNGVWQTPHIIRETPVQRRQVFSQATSDALRNLLRNSIQEAETSTVRLENVEVAGKTGTSRKPSADGRGYSADLYTSFVGFFPAKNPRVLTMVVVDSPQMAESWGSTVAGPIFRNIAEETVSYLGLDTAKIIHRDISSASVSRGETSHAAH